MNLEPALDQRQDKEFEESQPEENDNDNEVVEGYIFESMQRNV